MGRSSQLGRRIYRQPQSLGTGLGPLKPVLPKVFDSSLETDPALAEKKALVANGFSLAKAKKLDEAAHLATWLYALDRPDECEEVCKFVAQVEFKGNYALWSPVELCLAWLARCHRSRGQNPGPFLDKILAQNFVVERLQGSLCQGYENNAKSQRTRSGERDWLVLALKEICWIIEVRTARGMPLEDWEARFEAIQTRLKTKI